MSSKVEVTILLAQKTRQTGEDKQDPPIWPKDFGEQGSFH